MKIIVEHINKQDELIGKVVYGFSVILFSGMKYNIREERGILYISTPLGNRIIIKPEAANSILIDYEE